ncbi:hypothetical protein GCM10010211_58490 [Streptomyces albospinus]|uniref:Uncharacterized protein n=1 Tax=Streptomyces albospinus TaxID=285515 RepID=A0ABQ2VFR9_9ACTN|nr:hypothetical protein GCM10010211_58490 [Streptomyces albospinus]
MQLVGVCVDVVVRDVDEVAEVVSVGADDDVRPRGVYLREPVAQIVEEGQGQALALVGELVEDLGEVGGLAGESGQRESDGFSAADVVGDPV